MLSPEKYEVELKDGTIAKLKFTYGKDTVDRKVHVIQGIPIIWYTGNGGVTVGADAWDAKTKTFRRSSPAPKLLRDKKGKPVMLPIEVSACFLEITIRGSKFKSRSCCKPPDEWKRWEGRREALNNLFAQFIIPGTNPPKRDYHIISYDDRKAIMEACVPQLFKKHKKQTKPKVIEPNTVWATDDFGVLIRLGTTKALKELGEKLMEEAKKIPHSDGDRLAAKEAAKV